MKHIIFIANNNIGHGLSGGDRIFIELIRHWKKDTQITLFATEEAIDLLRVAKVDTQIIKTDTRNPNGDSFTACSMITHQLRRTIKGITAINNNEKIFANADYVYSVSDFFPDVIPAIYAKLKFKKSKWIAAFYFFAASPFSKESPYKGFAAKLRGFFYYVSQRIVYFFILQCADFIVLCNELDKIVIARRGFAKNHMHTIYGGVDCAIPNSVPKQKILYDAVFMARFHPQKGPYEAVKAWSEVVKIKPNAKLVMIGNGHEEKKVDEYIKDNKLQDNITRVGFMDGVEKYKLLKSARLFIHSAIYETGGMAAAEGMAAGLPVVAFDHEGFDYCYPKGMSRVAPVGDTKALAIKIIELLSNENKYQALKQEAIIFVKQWDWARRAEELKKSIGI